MSRSDQSRIRPSSIHPLSRRQLLATSAGVTIAAILPGSASMTSAQSPDAYLNIGMTGDGSTLDPASWTNINERHFIPAIFDNLVALDENLNLIPALATAWETSADGLTWTFTIRDNVLFHDGTPCDAEAVAFNIRYVLDEANALRHRADISMVTDAQATDAQTVTLTLSTPFSPLAATLYESVGYISSPTALQQYGADYGSNPVGTGPFKLEEWRRDSELRLTRFEDYWQADLPRAAGLSFKPIPDTSVKLTNLRSGTIDLVDEIAAADAESVEADAGLQLFSLPGSRWPMIRLNTIVAPFDNVLLRQAVTHAIPRDGIVQAIFFGRAQPAYGPISPIYSSVYNPDIANNALAYDLEAATSKMQEAGVSDGFSFTLDVGSTPQAQRMAELIQSSLASIGIEMQIQAQESAAFTERLRSKEFQAALGSWTTRPDVDGTMYQHFHTEGLANWTSYGNTEVDTLLEQTRSTPVGPERDELFREAELIIIQDAPWAFIAFEDLSRVARSAVTGYSMSPDTLLHLESVAVE